MHFSVCDNNNIYDGNDDKYGDYSDVKVILIVLITIMTSTMIINNDGDDSKCKDHENTNNNDKEYNIDNITAHEKGE